MLVHFAWGGRQSLLPEHSGGQMSLQDDEQQITALFEAGDRALMNADVAVLSRIFADDYVQYDSSGKVLSKEEILENLRVSAVQYPSIVSTGRRIRLFGEMAIVHGSESDEVESNGKRFSVQYLYMDVVLKREGKWQIVASQLVRPADEP
jgi:uncharacterized protein (TIGR02246 family)